MDKQALIAALDRLDGLLLEHHEDKLNNTRSSNSITPSARSEYDQTDINEEEIRFIANKMNKMAEEAESKSALRRSYMFEKDHYQESCFDDFADPTPRKSVPRRRKNSIVETSCQKHNAQDLDSLFEKIVQRPSKHQDVKRMVNTRKTSRTPEISCISRQAAASKTSGVPIHLRYSKEVQERENRLCSLKQTLEQEKLTRELKPPSTPTRKRSVLTSGDLEYHTKKFLERKEEKLRKVESDLRYEESQQLTFQPKINRNSARMIQKTGRKDASPVQERLYKEAYKRESRISELKEDLFRAKHPFRPVTNGGLSSKGSIVSSRRGEMSPSVASSSRKRGSTNEFLKITGSYDAEVEESIRKPKVPAQLGSTLSEAGMNFSFRETQSEVAVAHQPKAGPGNQRAKPARQNSPWNNKENQGYLENRKAGDHFKWAGGIRLEKKTAETKKAEEEYCPTFGHYRF